MRGEPFTIAGALDDNLVAGIGQPAQGAVAEDGVVEETEPFLHGPVGCDDEAGDPMAADCELVLNSDNYSCRCLTWECYRRFGQF